MINIINKFKPCCLNLIILVLLLSSCKNNYLIIGDFRNIDSDTLIFTFKKTIYFPDSPYNYMGSDKILDTVLLKPNSKLYYNNNKVKNSFATLGIKTSKGTDLYYRFYDKVYHFNPIFDFSKRNTRIETATVKKEPNFTEIVINKNTLQFELEKKLTYKEYFNIKISDYKDTIKYRYLPPYSSSYRNLQELNSEVSSLPYNAAISYFNSLSKTLRSSDKGKIVNRQIKAKNEIYNKSALLINEIMKNEKFDPLRIKSLIKDRPFTLLIYGASWCIPCRNNISNYKKSYEQLKSKTTFISISIDISRESWLKSIKEDNVPWLNILTASDFLRKKFEIYGIPYYMLLNSEGRIVSNGDSLSDIAFPLSNNIN